LRAAAPHIAATGLPLLTHAELPSALRSASRTLSQPDWGRSRGHSSHAATLR
jgi:hypothetical protein